MDAQQLYRHLRARAGHYATQPVNHGAFATAPSPAPDSTNYTFGGWYAEAACTTVWNFATDAVTTNTTLYAKWRAKVTFNANGGSITPPDTVVDLNQTVSGWAHVPTRTGYTFGGWFTDNGTFANGWTLATMQATRDTTLHAKWMLNSYTVTFERESGIIYTTQPVNHGYYATAPSPAPDSTGYVFGGWYADAACTTVWNFATDAVTANTTLHAKWTPILSPTLEVCDQPLPPVEGAGTPNNPFTGNVPLPVNTETLTPDDIDTGDTTDIVTLYYNPDYTNPVPPSLGVELYPGETATVYIAVQVGNTTFYYAVTVIRRSVTLPPVDGAATNPPAGIHWVSSGSDFVFTLTPTSARSNTPPLVRTGRNNLTDDVRITPNADGTYTVCVYAIRNDITLSIDFSTANADVAAAKVWSYGHTLYITATRDGEARIYSTAGQLVKALPYTAGATAETVLSQGVYIVVMNGRTYKVIIEN